MKLQAKYGYLWFCILFFIFIAGCSFVAHQPINPEPIHAQSYEDILKKRRNNPDLLSDVKDDKISGVANAEWIPVKIYYQKLEAAKNYYLKNAQSNTVTTTATATVTATVTAAPMQSVVSNSGVGIRTSTETVSPIGDYLDAGIALVNAYCLRWFQGLNDQSIYKQFMDESENLIYGLGTTLLGLGKANTYFVTSWGASNTFFKGQSANYSNSFLLGASPKIKIQVMNILNEEGKAIKTDKDINDNFMRAYTRLEQYADLCTSGTVRDIVSKSLDSVETHYKDGKLTVTVSSPAVSSTIANLNAEKQVAETQKVAAEATAKTAQADLAAKTDDLRTTKDELKDARSQLGIIQQDVKNKVDELTREKEKLAACTKALVANDEVGKKVSCY